MRIPLGLILLAAGTIATFAVTRQIPGLDLHLAGVIVMVTGAAVIVAGPRLPGWLWHRVTRLREGARPGLEPVAAAPEDGEDGYPAYLLQDPAVLAAEVLNSASAARASGRQAAAGGGAAPRGGRWTPEVITGDEPAPGP